METLNLIGMLFQTVVALVAVCGLAWVIFRVVLPRLQVGNSAGNMIRVVERVGLDAKRSLFVVEVAGKYLLVGSSENGVQLVSELDNGEAVRAEEQIQVHRDAQMQKITDLRSGFAEKLASVMKRKDLKNNAKPEPGKKLQFPPTFKK